MAGDTSAPGPSGHADRLAAATARTERTVADLRAEMEALAGATAGSPDDEHDAEGSTIGFERARVRALADAAEVRLRALRAAAGRAGTAAAGSCTVCGSPIGADRLEALPATDRCVRCAPGPAGGSGGVRSPGRPGR